MVLSHRTSQEGREGRNAADHTVRGQLGAPAPGWQGPGGCQAPRDMVGESVLAHLLDHSICSQGSSNSNLKLFTDGQEILFLCYSDLQMSHDTDRGLAMLPLSKLKSVPIFV